MAWDRLLLAAAAAAGLLGAGASIHARATMADAEKRISVLEAQRVEDKERLTRIETTVNQIWQRVR